METSTADQPLHSAWPLLLLCNLFPLATEGKYFQEHTVSLSCAGLRRVSSCAPTPKSSGTLFNLSDSFPQIRLIEQGLTSAKTWQYDSWWEHMYGSNIWWRPHAPTASPLKSEHEDVPLKVTEYILHNYGLWVILGHEIQISFISHLHCLHLHS